MPKPFPKEFRADVIAVARKGDQSIAQVAQLRGLGVLSGSLAEGRRPGGRTCRQQLAHHGRHRQRW